MYELLLSMIFGSAIGYGTNWLALKMVFRPREAKHVLGIRVPLTPGIFARRRGDFAKAVSELIEDKFGGGEDIHAVIVDAHKSGALDKALSEFGPVLRFAVSTYFRRSTADDFRRDCQRLSTRLRDGAVIRGLISRKIDDMRAEEIEYMVTSVVHNEFRALTWLGAVIGAVIGIVQWALLT